MIDRPDVDVRDKHGNTALHLAARTGDLAAAKALLARGAALDARNRHGHSPLAHALAEARNIDLEQLGPMSKLLVARGARITSAMRERVAQLGEIFEHYRADFAKDGVAAADRGLRQLYRLFEVPPAPRRELHGGRSLIQTKAKTWRKQHEELWELLVPANGPARTVQGEVIRISGKIAREVHVNGAMNWDRDFSHLARAFLTYIHDGKRLGAREDADAIRIVGGLVESHDGDTARLCELATLWVRQNPKPVRLGKVTYRR